MSWDSDFFKKKIGRMLADNPDNLPTLLEEAKKEDYRLIYVFGNKDFFVKDEILQQFNGKLVDRKVLFEKNIENRKAQSIFISEYTENELTSELEELAYISGEFSRFKSDDNFQKDDFYRMYKSWIENSVKKQIADHIFIAKENETVRGMATLKVDYEKGHIGLIAVASETRGKGYGKALISACETELLNRGISKLEVPTQSDNVQAVKFYEKCGFKIKEITNIYHFGL